jgi:hypothetical protein
VSYDYAGSSRTDAGLRTRVEAALGFLPRAEVADWAREQSGLTLCGAGTSCPGG